MQFKEVIFFIPDSGIEGPFCWSDCFLQLIFNLFRLFHIGDIDPNRERLNLQRRTFHEIERGPAVTAIVPGVRDVTFSTGEDRLYRCLRLRLLSQWMGRDGKYVPGLFMFYRL